MARVCLIEMIVVFAMLDVAVVVLGDVVALTEVALESGPGLVAGPA